MSVTEAEREALAEAIRRARKLEAEGQIGIVAAILREDGVLAWGENEVHLEHDPTRHAEIVAISRATQGQGDSDLAGTTLVTTLQPCEMCLSAMRWAGITRVVFAARQEAVGSDYFTFPRLGMDDFLAAGEPFEHVGGVLEADVLDLYK